VVDKVAETVTGTVPLDELRERRPDFASAVARLEAGDVDALVFLRIESH
jgi:hypothetical protein